MNQNAMNHLIRPIRILPVVFFCLLSTFSFDVYGQQIELLKDINPDSLFGERNGFPFHLTNFCGDLYFASEEGLNGVELWKSQGTNQTTQLVKNINKEAFEGSFPVIIGVANGRLILNAGTRNLGDELWASDGTKKGTVLLKDIGPGSEGIVMSYSVVSNNLLFFTTSTEGSGMLLWTTDGTANGTSQPLKMNAKNPINFLLSGMVPFKDGVIYSMNSRQDGSEIWKSNGTANGTVRLINYCNQNCLSNLSDLCVVNGFVYYTVNNEELWKSDGTKQGTTRIKILPKIPSTYRPSSLIEVNGTLYFTHNENVQFNTLWKSDGTSAGTVLVKDMNDGLTIREIDNLTSMNDKLYFTTSSGMSHYSLWKSDGTEYGTVIIKDFRTRNVSGKPYGLFNANGTLYFAANTEEFGTELWKSDGTPVGTVMVQDLNPGPYYSFPRFLTLVGDQLFFTAFRRDVGREIFFINVESPDYKKEQLVVFPNPAKQTVQLSSDALTPGDSHTVTVFDIAGRQIQQMLHVCSYPLILDLGNCVPGTYIIRLDNGLTGKVIKY